MIDDDPHTWLLTYDEITAISRTIPIGEEIQFRDKVRMAQMEKTVSAVYLWMFTHETSGRMTTGGHTWAQRLNQLMADHGFRIPSAPDTQ